MKKAERNAIACVLPATSHLYRWPAGGIWQSRPELWREIEEAVNWDTSKTLHISEFLYWLQVLGCVTVWKPPQDVQWVMLKHRCPKVPLLCPHVLSVTLVLSPLLPEQLCLRHLRCSWDRIAAQQMWGMVPTMVPPAGSQHWWEDRAGPGESGWDHPWGQFSTSCCSAPAALPALGLEFSTIFTLIFGVQMKLCSVFLGTELAANGAQSQQYTKWILKAKITC